MSIVVLEHVDFVDLLKDVRVGVATESGLVDEEVAKLLSMLDGILRVVSPISLAIFHAKLYSVDSEAYTEPGINYSFEGSNEFFILVLGSAVIVGAYRQKYCTERLLLPDKVLHRYAELNISEELELIERVL